MYCPMCGEKIYNIMKVCPFCNAEFKNIEILQERSRENLYRQFIPQNNEEKKEFCINDEIVVFEGKNLLRKRYLAVITNLNYFNRSQWDEQIQASENLDDLFNNGISKMLIILNLSASVTYSLTFNIGKQIKTMEEFLEDFYERVKLQEVLEEADRTIKDIRRDLEERVKRQQMQLERKNGSRWVGGGFGIKGAIKGSIQATVLNVGSDIIHSIGNMAAVSGLKASDRTAIDNRKKEIYDSGKFQYKFSKIIDKVAGVSHTYVNSALDKKYGKASDSEKEDGVDVSSKLFELQEKIDIDKMSEEEKERAIKPYIFLLKRAPSIPGIYSGIYELKEELGEPLVCMAKYFGIAKPVMEDMLKIDYKKLVKELSSVLRDDLYRKKALEEIEYIKNNNPAFTVNFDFGEKTKILELERKVNK